MHRSLWKRFSIFGCEMLPESSMSLNNCKTVSIFEKGISQTERAGRAESISNSYCYPRLGSPVVREDFVMVTLISSSPRHPQAYVLTLGALAAFHLKGHDAYWKMFDALYEAFDDFSDEVVYHKSRHKIETEVAEIAVRIGMAQSTEEFMQEMKEDRNMILAKLEQRYGRQNSIHFSPTYMINGVVAADLSSGSTLEQWGEILKPLCKEHPGLLTGTLRSDLKRFSRDDV